jgi:hypothetical protein
MAGLVAVYLLSLWAAALTLNLAMCLIETAAQIASGLAIAAR